MKVAFDVKGTLVGYHQDKVRKLLKWFQGQGAEITVWSNLYQYAYEAAEELRIDNVETKYSSYDAKEQGRTLFDFCIEDDHGQWYLATKQIIFVDMIPDDERFFPALLANAPKQEDLR